MGVMTTRVLAPRVLSQFAFANAYRGQEAIVVVPSLSCTEGLRSALQNQGCSNMRLVEFDDDPLNKPPWP
jgi:hypothetical protein